MLQPVVRRTWAPRGQTPVQWQYDRHDRVSAISALTLAPKRNRLGLYWQTMQRNITSQDVVAFLRSVRTGRRRKILLILDHWSVHEARPVREYLERHAASIRLEWLPPYAPDLNPTEQVWNHAKYADLANFSPADSDELQVHVRLSFIEQRAQSGLLRSFFTTAGLTL